ncbi:MAG: hypothetical protein Q9201_005677 [Fulgogasparrea decipioides]
MSGAANKQTMKWDDGAEKYLLMKMIADQEIKLDYPTLAYQFGCSVNAVQQRACKLKRDAKELVNAPYPPTTAGGDGGKAGEAPAKPKAAPRKRAPKKVKETTDAAKSISEAPVQDGANSAGNDNNDGGVQAPPVAKKRKTAAPRKTKAEKALESAMAAPKSVSNVDDGADAPVDGADNEEIKSMHTGALGEVATAISNEDI